MRSFDLKRGNGLIDWAGRELFFNFTAIPGEGYRTILPGTAVQFEVVENKTRLTARNIQVVKG